LTALRQRKYHESLLTKTDNQLLTLTELVSTSPSAVLALADGIFIAIDDRILADPEPGVTVSEQGIRGAQGTTEGDESGTGGEYHGSCRGRRCRSTGSSALSSGIDAGGKQWLITLLS
jgi:hypothetical protein